MADCWNWWENYVFYSGSRGLQQDSAPLLYGNLLNKVLLLATFPSLSPFLTSSLVLPKVIFQIHHLDLNP